MADFFSADLVSKLMDYGLVALIGAILLIFVRVNVKKDQALKKSDNVQPIVSAQFQKPGNFDEITAAISAAVNEYRKNNQ
jgi:hypothetical protein